MTIEDRKVRELIKQKIAEGELSGDPMVVEEMLKRQGSYGARNADPGMHCACWRGKLCRYHNLLYHGET